MKIQTGSMCAVAMLTLAMSAVATAQSAASQGSTAQGSSSQQGSTTSGSDTALGRVGATAGQTERPVGSSPSDRTSGGAGGSMGSSSSGGSSSGMGGSSASGSSSMDSSSRMGASGASGTLAAADRKFMMEAASGGMLEVAAGRLAATQAQDPQIKAFGQRMVTDHTQANQQLMSLASAKGVQLPTSMERKHQQMVDKLQAMSGAEFDRAYASMMAKDHKEDVEAFRKASRDSKDPDLKSFATQTLPTLQDHYATAQTLPGAKGSRQAMGDAMKDSMGDDSTSRDSGTPKP